MFTQKTSKRGERESKGGMEGGRKCETDREKGEREKEGGREREREEGRDLPPPPRPLAPLFMFFPSPGPDLCKLG